MALSWAHLFLFFLHQPELHNREGRAPERDFLRLVRLDDELQGVLPGDRRVWEREGEGGGALERLHPAVELVAVRNETGRKRPGAGDRWQVDHAMVAKKYKLGATR